MKRAMPILLACLLLLGLTACFGGGENPAATTTAPATEPTQTQTTTAAPEITTQVVEAIIDPDFDAEALFQRLEGVWDNEYERPGDVPLRGFTSFLYDNGKPILYKGPYDGESGGAGTLLGGRENAGEGTVTLYFQYPAIDGWPGPLPERTDALQIDLAGIDDGELRIQLTTIWRTNDWENNTYRCKTLREAGIRKAF